MNQYQQPSHGLTFNKQFPYENSSASNMININFLPAIIVPIERYLPEKSNQPPEHSPKNVTVMEEETPKTTSDIRADNAPINIKNLG